MIIGRANMLRSRRVLRPYILGLPMEVCWRGVVPMARVLRTYIPHRYPGRWSRAK